MSNLSYNINDLVENSVPEALGTPNFTVENTPSFRNVAVSGISTSDLVAGEMQGNTTVTDGFLQSSNYSSGADGWKLTPTSAEINVPTALLSLAIPDNVSANSFHVDSSGNVWWGSILIGGAVGKVLNTGVATFSDMNITGGSVATSALNGLVPLSNTNVSAQGWTFTGAFTSVDYNTIAWATGTFTTAVGTAYTISAGNTGNMAATTYIYLNIAASTTVLQVTTTAATAIGSGKVLIAVASVNTDTTSDAMVQVFGGTGGQIMSVDNLAANSASTNEFVSNTAQIANATITNAKITDLEVAKLTAGTITSKAITMAVAAGTGDTKIQAGKTDFGDTTAGFILGVDDSVVGDPAKFEIGNSTNFLNWDGAELEVAGKINLGGTNITVGAVADIQTALNDVATAGGGTVFLQPGTYTLTADITIASGVTLEGISRDGCIIDCDSDHAVKIAGTNVYSTGTVTIANGDTEVVGDSTTWTAGMIGRYIHLLDYWYEITARTDNTHITIGGVYNGNTDLSGSAYVIADTVFTAQIRKLTVTNATGSGIIVQYAMEPTLYDTVVYDCGTGMDMDYVVFPIIQTINEGNGVGLDMNWTTGFYIDYSEFESSTTGAGVVMTNTDNATFFNTSVNDNTGDGINMTNCAQIAFISLDVSGNGGQGIEMVSGCHDNIFESSVFDSNVSDGLKLTATSDRNNITACSITNSGGYGVNIVASTCDNNYIVSPTFDTNASGNISDSGTGTVIIKETDVVFGGTGADGALTISSGTTTLDLSGASSFEKNYSSISITGTGKLAFSNPANGGTVIVIKSQGDVTLTSSTTPTIDCSGLGALGGTGATDNTTGGGGTGVNGSAGSNGANFSSWISILGGGGNDDSTGGAGGTAIVFQTLYPTLTTNNIKYSDIFVGAGGGGGAAHLVTGDGPTVGGTGGRGGGALIIECGGAYNFGASSNISVGGAVGSAGVASGTASAAGGGGGGGGGYLLVLYKSLTANSGSYTTTGGAGGDGDSIDSTSTKGGGGGGGRLAGTDGTYSADPDGGAGGAGVELVGLNKMFT